MLELARAYCEKRKQQSTVILWQPNPREQFQAELETRPSTHLTTACSPQPAAICKTDKGPTGLAFDRVWSLWSLWKYREGACAWFFGPSRKGKCYHVGLLHYEQCAGRYLG